MQTVSLSVGIDVSKDTLAVYLERLNDDRSYSKAGTRNFPNTGKGIKQLIKWLVRKGENTTPLQVTMEATGRYHESLAYALIDEHIRTSIVLPNRIKNFARSLNEYSKTDPIDARIIARYTTLHNPKTWTPANKSMRQLRELSRERQDVIHMRTQAKCRIAAFKSGHEPPKKIITRVNRQIRLFDLQLEQIQADMERLRNQDDQLDLSVKLLTSIPHVGLLTAYTLIAETGGFELFENRNQLIKYAGLDVVERQSGSTLLGKSKISKRGNSHLRTAPYMGSMSINKTNSVFQQTYQRKIDQGQPKKKARTAVVRQIIQVAYGVHKSGQYYDENIHRLRANKRVDELESSPTVTALAN